MPSETRRRVHRSVVSSPEMGQYCLGIGRPVTLSVNDCSRVPSPPARTIADLCIRTFTCGLIRELHEHRTAFGFYTCRGWSPFRLPTPRPRILARMGSAINLSKDIADGLPKYLAVRARRGIRLAGCGLRTT